MHLTTGYPAISILSRFMGLETVNDTKSRLKTGLLGRGTSTSDLIEIYLSYNLNNTLESFPVGCKS